MVGDTGPGGRVLPGSSLLTRPPIRAHDTARSHGPQRKLWVPMTEWLTGVTSLLIAGATIATAIAACLGYRRIVASEKPSFDLELTLFKVPDNVANAKLTVRNRSGVKIVSRRIRLLKPKMPSEDLPKVGLASAEQIEPTAAPRHTLEEPFEIGPGSESNKEFSIYLYRRGGGSVTVKLGIDIEYLGAKVRKERLKITRKLKLPEARPRSY